MESVGGTEEARMPTPGAMMSGFKGKEFDRSFL